MFTTVIEIPVLSFNEADNSELPQISPSLGPPVRQWATTPIRKKKRRSNYFHTFPLRQQIDLFFACFLDELEGYRPTTFLVHFRPCQKNLFIVVLVDNTYKKKVYGGTSTSTESNLTRRRKFTQYFTLPESNTTTQPECLPRRWSRK